MKRSSRHRTLAPTIVVILALVAGPAVADDSDLGLGVGIPETAYVPGISVPEGAQLPALNRVYVDRGHANPNAYTIYYAGGTLSCLQLVEMVKVREQATHAVTVSNRGFFLYGIPAFVVGGVLAGFDFAEYWTGGILGIPMAAVGFSGLVSIVIGIVRPRGSIVHLSYEQACELAAVHNGRVGAEP